MCQNSTQKQIRHNTRKWTIHIDVKLKVCSQNLSIFGDKMIPTGIIFAATHSSTSDKTLQSFYFTAFIQFDERKISTTWIGSTLFEIITLHAVFYSTKGKKILQTTRMTVNKKSELCTVGLGILPSVGVWAEDLANVINTPLLWLGIRKNIPLWAESSLDWLHLNVSAAYKRGKWACGWWSSVPCLVNGGKKNLL